MKKQLLSILILLFSTHIMWSQKTERSGWYVKDYTEATAKSYFESRYSLDLIEGIWQSNDGFKYAIERDVENGKRSSDTYRVIVLESSSDGWHLSQIKGFITYSSISRVYSLKYYTRNNQGGELSSQNVLMVVENPLLVSFNRIDGGGKIQLFKLYPKASSDNGESILSHNDKKWSGSSIVIGNKLLVTNYHVVEGAETLSISGSGEYASTEYSVEIVAADKNNDLAIIKVTDSKFEGFEAIPYGMVTTNSDIGTEVFVMGYPLVQALGSDVKLTNGIISSKTGYQGDVSMYQISAPIQPGNSGGPLFDNIGNLIGIVNAGIPDAENVGYAIKLSYLKNLIESSAENININTTNLLYNYSLSEKVKKLSKFVWMVKANMSKGTLSNSINNATSINGFYKMASQLFSEKKYEEAYDYAKKAVESEENEDGHYLRGYLALIFNDFEISAESMQYCINKNHKIQECYTILQHSLFGQRKYEETISICEKSLNLDRKDVGALYLRGQCKALLGNKAAALIDFNQAIKYEGLVDYAYESIYNNLAYIYLESNDFITATKYILSALSKNHFDGNYWDSYGEILYKQGKYEECVRSMGAALYLAKGSKKPYLMNTYYYRGLAYKKLGFDADSYNDLINAADNGNEQAKIAIDSLFANNNQMSCKHLDIYRNPHCQQNNKSLKITAVECSEEYTTIYFSCIQIGGWININKDSYIVDANTGEKLYMIDASNIAISPNKTNISNKLHSFTLTFPALRSDCESINFSEGTNNDGFSFMNIKLDDSGTNIEIILTPEEVAVTDDISYAEGLIAVETRTEKSAWGGSAGTQLGIKKATMKLQERAASLGCCLIVITKIEQPFMTEVTGILYKRP